MITPTAAPSSVPAHLSADRAEATIADTFDNFLQLLTTQLKNQDPISPMDATEFTNQLVSFTQVEQQIVGVGAELGADDAHLRPCRLHEVGEVLGGLVEVEPAGRDDEHLGVVDEGAHEREELPLPVFGEPDYPDRSATVFVQTAGLSDTGGATLSGPGIDGTRSLGIAGADAGVWQREQALDLNHELLDRLPVAVIEGDQQTSRDADRIRATGVPAVQINTGKGGMESAEEVQAEAEAGRPHRFADVQLLSAAVRERRFTVVVVPCVSGIEEERSAEV